MAHAPLGQAAAAAIAQEAADVVVDEAHLHLGPGGPGAALDRVRQGGRIAGPPRAADQDQKLVHPLGITEGGLPVKAGALAESGAKNGSSSGCTERAIGPSLRRLGIKRPPR